ncbi:23S rRNA (uracil(1939)-C(5))-methyltransferase RlmD [Nanoarchaeota archaeon]
MTDPRCRHFGKCGGCSFQNIDYEQQLEQKKRQLATAINNPEIAEKIQVFSGQPYNYRCRMDFVFHIGGIGFREKGKWQHIINITECPISNKKLNLIAGEIRDFFKEPDFFHVKRHSGTFRYAVIRTPQDDSSISFVLNSDSSRIADAIEQIKEFAKTSTANNIIVTYVQPNTDSSISDDFFAVKGTDTLKETYLDKTFIYHVQGFFQNNHAMAEKMHTYVNTLIQSHDTKDHHLLDLYGGVGTFGIINATHFKSTTIVEGFQQCIDAAEKNIELNQAPNTKAICKDDRQLKNLDLPSPLFVITDPPRSGMNPKTIKHLNRTKPDTIIYVSCNLSQLAKDLKKFQNYTLKSAALFDLFPQTPHCEAVVELIKK